MFTATQMTNSLCSAAHLPPVSCQEAATPKSGYKDYVSSIVSTYPQIVSSTNEVLDGPKGVWEHSIAAQRCANECTVCGWHNWKRKCTRLGGYRRPMSTPTTGAGRLTDEEPENVRFALEEFNTLTERRTSHRVSLHWTVYLSCGGLSHPFCTKTRDISRDGFYCLVDRPLKPGERIECDIVIPTHTSQDPGGVAYLRCRAQAVRVEKFEAAAEFGIACRIEDYSLVRGSDPVLYPRQAGEVQGTRYGSG